MANGKVANLLATWESRKFSPPSPGAGRSSAESSNADKTAPTAPTGNKTSATIGTAVASTSDEKALNKADSVEYLDKDHVPAHARLAFGFDPPAAAVDSKVEGKTKEVEDGETVDPAASLDEKATMADAEGLTEEQIKKAQALLIQQGFAGTRWEKKAAKAKE